MLELSRVEIGADQPHRGESATRPRSGAGVLIGIIDTGIDLNHPAFKRGDGSSKVVAFWDQDGVGGQVPSRFGYGAHCPVELIRAGRCSLNDELGHGTHVAGIAAGLDGIAPDAELVMVRSGNFTRIADAVSYIFDVADQLDRPAVVNLSVGGHYGPHDGNTPLESYIERELGKGRLMVAAVGNDGDDRLHARIDLSGEPMRLAIEDMPVGVSVDTVVELWSAFGDSVDVAVEIWRGEERLSAIPLRASETDELIGTIRRDGVEVLYATYIAEWNPDHRRIARTVTLERPTALDENEVVVLALSGTGSMHAWISQSDYRYGMARFGAGRGPGWASGDGENSVTVPATSKNVIAVGAYTVRSDWVSESGEAHVLEFLPGWLTPYSSRGPTTAPNHTGFKPLITAPGSVIASARSHWVPQSIATIDEERLVMQGTSMAAPHVAGVLAM
ncbi:MAG: S8 family serine peptidase, partial [Myxococcota bacterium]